MTNEWKVRKKPSRLERRLEFSDYEQTREFLDQAASLSEEGGYYPDLSFGRTYVSVVLNPVGEKEAVGDEEYAYAEKMDELAEAARAVC